MKTNNTAPQGARPMVWVPAIIVLMIAVCVMIVSRTPKHIEGNSAKTVQATPKTSILPSSHSQVARVESAPQSVDSHSVIIDQGGTVTFSAPSKVKPPMLTEKQVLAMQREAKLVAAINKQ